MYPSVSILGRLRSTILRSVDSTNFSFFHCQKRNIGHFKQTNTVLVIEVGSWLLFELYFECGLIVVPCYVYYFQLGRVYLGYIRNSK